MARKKYSLTKEHEAQLKPWSEKWIGNAMSVEPMTDEDRTKTERAINGIYEAAGLPRPQHIVFVSSPFIAAFAAGLAAAVWHISESDPLTEAATWAATEDATWAATRAATWAATRDATWAATEAATWAATWAATEAATWAATRDATWAATEAATWAATEAATEAATRAATRDATWAAWYSFPEAKMILSIIKSLGLPEELVYGCMEKVGRLEQGGNQWSAVDGILSFFDRVAKLDLPEYGAWRHWEQASLHSGPRYVHKRFCIISDRPERLLVDSQNQPHCDDGPFCRWRDGSALYAVHGVRVPAWIVEFPEKITPEKISNESNAEVRRVMMSKYGWEKMLDEVGAEKIDEHVNPLFGSLWRWTDKDGIDVQVLKVTNGTVTKNGTREQYSIRVPLEFNNVVEAHRWTYPELRQMPIDDYIAMNESRT